MHGARWPRTALLVATAWVSQACLGSGTTTGNDGATADCPNDLPATCPMPTPSYATDIAPILQERCTRCHGPGGQESNRPFVTYAQVHASRSSILNQVYACSMPPVGEPAPSAEQRRLLLGWLVCGAPDN